MKKLSNAEAELKKSVAYKKKRVVKSANCCENMIFLEELLFYHECCQK